MPSRNTVHVEAHFKEWGIDAEERILSALAEVAEPMAEAAKTAEVRRMSQALADSIHPLTPVRTPKGFQGGIGASDYKAVWYELGTHGSRSKRIKHARTDSRAGAREANRKASKGDGSGVKALHYLRKGLTAGRVTAFAKISEALAGAKSGLL